MTQGNDWQGRVGDNWALEHARTDRSLEAVNAALLERTDRVAPEAARILDIGCGAGATSVALARRYPYANVRGVDLSQSLIDAAKARPETPTNLSFTQGDASLWSGGDFRPDLLVSRHGVMFFDDPVAAFHNLARAADEDARLVFSCFRDRTENGWASELAEILPPSPAVPLTAPGPFAFADVSHVTDILEAAGWQDIRFEPLDFAYVAGGGDDPVADAVSFFCRIGPAASAIAALDGKDRAAMLDRLTILAQDHLTDNNVTFSAAAWIVSACREG